MRKNIPQFSKAKRNSLKDWLDAICPPATCPVLPWNCSDCLKVFPHTKKGLQTFGRTNCPCNRRNHNYVRRVARIIIK